MKARLCACQCQLQPEQGHRGAPFTSAVLTHGPRPAATLRARRSQPKCVTTTPQKPKLVYDRYVRQGARTGDGVSASFAEWSVVHEGQLEAPAITKSDEQFLKEHLEFVLGQQDLNLTELNDLFELVGFPRRDLGKLKTAMDNTHAIIWVRSNKGTRWARLGQLLGFARATSDKALSATIWDVAVHPAWQRGGLGRGLVERLTAGLVTDDIQTICLYAEPGVVGMYEKLGFVKDPQGIKGMAFQRKSTAGAALLAATAVAA